MIKKFLLTSLVIAAMTSATGCVKPYDKPQIETIEASQTAILIPLVGDTSDQASFKSEDMLRQGLVASKEIQIPHRWVQTGRMSWDGEWRPSAKLIVVDRTPITREWNSGKDSGTSARNQAIYAESAESIGFSVGMNITAQIDTEDDAVKFLYSYNAKSLANTMDTEIRSKVEAKFNEIVGKMTMNDIIKNKAEIMDDLRNDVITYFKDRGVTITTLGLKDGVDYDDEAIQKAINEKFSSEQKLVTQENNNKVKLSAAEADATAKIKAAEAEAKANQIINDSLTDKLLKKIKYEKWDGHDNARVVGNGTSTIIDMRD